MTASRGLLIGGLCRDTFSTLAQYHSTLSSFHPHYCTHEPTKRHQPLCQGSWAVRQFPPSVLHPLDLGLVTFHRGKQNTGELVPLFAFCLHCLLQEVKDLIVTFSLPFCPNQPPQYLITWQWEVGMVFLLIYFVWFFFSFQALRGLFRNVSGIHWIIIWLYICETLCSLCSL